MEIIRTCKKPLLVSVAEWCINLRNSVLTYIKVSYPANIYKYL